MSRETAAAEAVPKAHFICLNLKPQMSLPNLKAA
jgi:hypothetical protein